MTDGRTDRQMDGRTDGRTERQTEGRTDKQTGPCKVPEVFWAENRRRGSSYFGFSDEDIDELNSVQTVDHLVSRV